MTAIATQGITLKVSIPGSPTQLAAVAHVTNFNLAVSAPEIDTTDLDSTAYEGFSGVPKYTFSADFNLDPDNARHQELRDAIKNRTRVQCQLTLTDSTPATCTFEGFVTSWNIGGGVNDKVAGSTSIAIDRGVTWG